MVKELAAHYGFAQNIKRGGRLSVGVVAKLHDALGIGHDGNLVQGRGPHVVHDIVGWSAARRIVDIPLLLGKLLHEAVKAFVHPSPLPLVAVNNHGEVVVANLMDNYAYHTVLGSLGVGSVRVRPASVEADHRVFHAYVCGVH